MLAIVADENAMAAYIKLVGSKAALRTRLGSADKTKEAITQETVSTYILLLAKHSPTSIIGYQRMPTYSPQLGLKRLNAPNTEIKNSIRANWYPSVLTALSGLWLVFDKLFVGRGL